MINLGIGEIFGFIVIVILFWELLKVLLADIRDAGFFLPKNGRK